MFSEQIKLKTWPVRKRAAAVDKNFEEGFPGTDGTFFKFRLEVIAADLVRYCQHMSALQKMYLFSWSKSEKIGQHVCPPLLDNWQRATGTKAQKYPRLETSLFKLDAVAVMGLDPIYNVTQYAKKHRTRIGRLKRRQTIQERHWSTSCNFLN